MTAPKLSIDYGAIGRALFAAFAIYFGATWRQLVALALLFLWLDLVAYAGALAWFAFKDRQRKGEP